MKTCQYCGQPGLTWGHTPEWGWRLFDSHSMHECLPRVAPRARRAKIKAEPTTDTRPAHAQRLSAYEQAREEYRASYFDTTPLRKVSSSLAEIHAIPTSPMSGPEFDFD